MSDEKCRRRVVARVVSTLSQLVQPRNTPGVTEVFTTAVIDAVEKEVPPPPRRHHRRGWCASAEALAAFILACTAREDAPPFLRAPPRKRVEHTEICVYEPAEDDCRRTACVLRKEPRQNRTISTELWPEGI